QRTNHRPERRRGASGPADDLAEVIGVYPNLEHRSPPLGPRPHGDVVGIVDDAADEVFQRLSEHARQEFSAGASAAASDADASSASAAAALASSASALSAFVSSAFAALPSDFFGSAFFAFFFGVVASAFRDSP